MPAEITHCSEVHILCYTSFLFGINAIHAMLIGRYLSSSLFILLMWISSLNHCYYSHHRQNKYVAWLDTFTVYIVSIYAWWLIFTTSPTNEYIGFAGLLGAVAMGVYYYHIRPYPYRINNRTHIMFHTIAFIAYTFLLFGLSETSSIHLIDTHIHDP
jgi:hypothetical protein